MCWILKLLTRCFKNISGSSEYHLPSMLQNCYENIASFIGFSWTTSLLLTSSTRIFIKVYHHGSQLKSWFYREAIFHVKILTSCHDFALYLAPSFISSRQFHHFNALNQSKMMNILNFWDFSSHNSDENETVWEFVFISMAIN